MPADPVFEIGDKVIGKESFGGHGDVPPLKGRVVDTKETNFGFRYAEVRRKDGTKQWARTIYLSPRGKS